MILEYALYPECGSNEVVKHGRTQAGKQRYKCRNSECHWSTFIQPYANRGYQTEVKQQITELDFIDLRS